MLELLQIQPSTTAKDISFGLFEIATVVGWAISICTLYFTLKYNIKENAKSIETLTRENKANINVLKEKLIDVKIKKEALKAEFSLEIEKKDKLTHKRIDAIRTDFKEHQVSSNSEFKMLNRNMSEIKGMLTQILNR
jgi:predicted  nucleic acid-binding Zn-ribbon protein